MGKRLIAAFAVLLLAACGGGETRRVEKPVGEVRATLASMPAEADVMDMAVAFPGTTYFLEAGGDQLTWHFTHNGQDYGRFVAELEEDGPGATTLTTRFENASDAELAGDLEFLRKVARQAAETSVIAALSGRSVDREAFGRQFAALMATNPLAAQKALVTTLADQMNRVAADMDSMAPEDPCLSDTDSIREQCEAFEDARAEAEAAGSGAE